LEGEVERVEGRHGAFCVRLPDGREFEGRHVVFATGVEDLSPKIPAIEECEGRGLRYCPICDGYESNGKRLALFGKGDSLATHALFMTTFTDKITLMFNGEGRWEEISPQLRERLERKGIGAVECCVKEVLLDDGEIRGFRMEDGTTLEVDRAYGGNGLRPRSELARGMGVETNADGYIKVDANGATNVKGVYAIGDVVNQDYAQIVIAMGQAAIAAIDIHGEFMAEG
jgi:thioredoxin reductase (NADPH)